MWAEKSTEKPMPMIRTIILMTSRLIPRNDIIPKTPTSTERTAKTTQMTQILLGMNMKMMTAMMAKQRHTQRTV